MRPIPIRRGFTLAELAIAAAITVVIGAAVTGVAVGLSNAQEHSEEYHRSLRNAQTASIRLPETLRRALLVTAGSDDRLVLWAEDTNDDGEINVSEVLKIYFDVATHQLIERSYIFPEAMAQDTRDALDYTLSLGEVDDTSICESGSLYPQYDTKRVLANNVRSFELQFSPDSPETKMVAFGLVVGEGDNAVKIRGAARLRADQVSRVGKSDDKYVLLPDQSNGLSED